MLEVDRITTRYGAITALHEASVSVSAGELVAIVGPNGAGKTTLLNTVAGVLRPATGNVRFDGNDITGAEPARLVRAGLALVPEHRRLFNDLTVEENLEFFASIFNTSIEENYDLVKEIYVQIEPFKDRRAGKLSGGMKQKLALCCALIHKPSVLFLFFLDPLPT